MTMGMLLPPDELDPEDAGAAVGSLRCGGAAGAGFAFSCFGACLGGSGAGLGAGLGASAFG